MISIIAATGNDIQNSGMNIDYTITTNGLKLVDPELTEKSLAYSYAGVDPALVEAADKIAKTDDRAAKSYHIGSIEAETGMGDPLSHPVQREIQGAQAPARPRPPLSPLSRRGGG